MSDTDKYYTPKGARTPGPLFKTPSSKMLSTQKRTRYTPYKTASDSEGSTSDAVSDNDHAPVSSGNDELTIVAAFDDLMRLMKCRRHAKAEDAFNEFGENTLELLFRYKEMANECRRLQKEVDKKTLDNDDLEGKLVVAKKLVDQQRRKAERIKEERDSLESQIAKIRDYLFRDNKSGIADETREHFAFLNTSHGYNGSMMHNGHLTAIPEVNTTGSILSDLSVTRSEDDLDVSDARGNLVWKKHRPSLEPGSLPTPKRRRSTEAKVVEIGNADKVRATTTVTVPKEGPITATSIIEALPITHPSAPSQQTEETPNNMQPSAPPANLIYDMWQQQDSPRYGGMTPRSTNKQQRQHQFQSKTMVIPEPCTVCERRIGFSRNVLKCKSCRGVCHPECKDGLPLPCIASLGTPTQRGMLGAIGDYTPTTPPMVPALIVHCINEIEHRGLDEVGIYRVSASERDVKVLKEKFLKGKGSPNLSQLDIHAVCGTVKDFLRSLREPLVTHKLWPEFVHTVEAREEHNVVPALYQTLSDLPQPNRDTLAFLILHLRKVANSPECKMPIDNLAKVFGPTVVGYSTPDPEPAVLFTETRQQFQVMDRLLRLPLEYWQNYVNVDDNRIISNRMQQTPSTDSLLRPSIRAFTGFTPMKRKQKN